MEDDVIFIRCYGGLVASAAAPYEAESALQRLLGHYRNCWPGIRWTPRKGVA
jgi:hypothetical protein